MAPRCVDKIGGRRRRGQEAVADGVDVPVDSREVFGEDAGELVRKLVDPVPERRSRN
jgi:hypothetical protein